MQWTLSLFTETNFSFCIRWISVPNYRNDFLLHLILQMKVTTHPSMQSAVGPMFQSQTGFIHPLAHQQKCNHFSRGDFLYRQPTSTERIGIGMGWKGRGFSQQIGYCIHFFGTYFCCIKRYISLIKTEKYRGGFWDPSRTSY